ncbi:MAG: Ig-like domain-containing protein, partial [Ruminiclostridium sp.]|nr:Ig-like domain-containing protein [Ruminiclostridium sp.]
YKLEELLLVSKSYKLEYPQEMFIGRRKEIVVNELPGGFRNYQCRVECERNGVIETEEMTVYGKGAGIANLTIHVMEKNQWKIIENISIRVINMTLISELSLFPKNMFLSTGMEKKFQLMYKPDNAENTNEIQWTVSNPEVATVMQDGTVSGNTPGRCEITAFTEEASCSVQVEVQPSINDIILPAGFLSLSIGEKASFKYTLVPENCYERELVKVFNSNAHAIDFSGGYIIARNQGTSTLSIYTPNDRIKRTCVVEVKKKGLFG